MRLRIHLGLNTKALTWWLTTIRTAGQDEGLWRIKQRFCFVSIVTEVQTGLLIKGKHDTIKFFLLIPPRTKSSAKNTFFAQRVRSISLWATYPYFLDEACLVQTNYVDFRNDRENFVLNSVNSASQYFTFCHTLLVKVVTNLKVFRLKFSNTIRKS